jgi:hypothetical protein
MNCPRCNGFIDRDYMPSETEYTLMRPCFRCINCGWRNDLVYNLNRANQKKEVSNVSR